MPFERLHFAKLNDVLHKDTQHDHSISNYNIQSNITQYNIYAVQCSFYFSVFD
jgi:hypothetical protein